MNNINTIVIHILEGEDLELLSAAMNEIETLTMRENGEHCIRFQLRERNETDYVMFRREGG